MLQALSLLRNRNFALAWLTTIIEHLGLAIALITETWYVVDTLHMKAQLGWVMIAGTVPRIALMAVGGVLADRHSKIRILSTTFWMRMAAMAGGALLFHQGWMTIWALIAFAALFGALDAFFWPARDALLPSIVEEDQLTRANSLMQATNQLGLVLGPIIGGALLSLMPPWAIFGLAAAMMAAGALLISTISDQHKTRPADDKHLLAELREGISYVASSPVLRSLILIYVCANLLFMGPLGLGVPIIASEHLTHGAAGLSYMQSAFGAGMALGFLSLIAFPPTRKRLLVIVGVITVEGVLLAFLGNVYLLWLAVSLQFAMGFCIACNNAPMLSLIQQHADRSKLGRVMSLNSMCSMGLAPVSYGMVSVLLSAGASITVLLPAFGLTMSAVVIAIAIFSPAVRRTD